jgi:hypothetical protein
MNKLIIVDIQPAHSKFIDFDMSDFISWLNDSDFDEIYCFYNGSELGYDDDDVAIKYWYQSWGLDYDVDIQFFEKNYGWFRDFMEDIGEDDIISIGKYMIEHDIVDSRDFKKLDIKILDEKDIDISPLVTGHLVMYLPELQFYISNNIYSRDTITTCGGGVDECYKEVLMLLDMMVLEYEEKIKFIY